MSSRVQILRLMIFLIGAACAGYLLLAALAGGLHRDDATDRMVTFAFALAAVVALALVAARRARWGAILFAALAAGGIAWDLAIGASLRETWGFWAALAVAGGLSWAAHEERG